jgi:hypothetical protein
MMVMEIFVAVKRIFELYLKFCLPFEDTNVDKNLAAVALVNKTLEDNPIYSTPILVIAGLFQLIFYLIFMVEKF